MEEAEERWRQCVRAVTTNEGATQCDRWLEAEVLELALRAADVPTCEASLEAGPCAGVASFRSQYCGVEGRRVHWEGPEPCVASRDVTIYGADVECRRTSILVDAATCRTAKYYDLAYCDDLERLLEDGVALGAPLALRVRLERVLADATPARDDYAWTRSRFPLCAAPEVSSDCDGVEDYLARFPRGQHALEATQLLASTEVARRKLALREIARWEKTKACVDDCVRRCTGLGINGLDCEPRCRTRCDE